MKRFAATPKVLVVALAMCGVFSSLALSQTRGGNVTVVLNSDPPGLNLAFPSDGPAQLVGSKIYEGLVTYTSDLKPQPSLAKSWTISDDGLTYTFKLRPNVKWHDGKDFSSADVVFSFNKMLPATSASARTAFKHVETIEAPDAETVVIKLKKRVPYFMMVFPSVQMPVMPKHVYEGTDYAKNPANAKPIGTGPFKLAEWKRGSYLRLVRNETYWNKDRPLLDAITFRIIPDAASRAIALEIGDIQVATSIDLSSVDIERFRKDRKFVVTPVGWEYMASMASFEMNLRKPLLGDVRFRRALYHAIDRNFILTKIWLGVGKIATGPINSQIPFYSKNLPQYEFAPEKAKALLEEMGLRADGTGVRFDSNGNRVKVSLLVLPGDERYTRLAEYAREAWQAVGVKVDLQTTDLAGWADRIRNWNYEVAITSLSQFADPGIGIRRYHHSANISQGTMFTNTSGYANPDVDKWFDEADVEMDPTRRGERYAKIQKKLIEDVAMLWVLEVQRLTIHSNRVNELITTAFGPRGPWDQAYVAATQ